MKIKYILLYFKKKLYKLIRKINCLNSAISIDIYSKLLEKLTFISASQCCGFHTPFSLNLSS